jgi:NADP-dependent 3-hydroxy acid dehydrogenase YdfG
MTRSLTDRVVVRTGITAGIGRVTALRLVDRGARVVGCAAMDLTRRVLPGMLARGDGDIVMISPVAAWVPTPSLAVYSGTKAGVDGFAQALRREVGARGVRVHTVNPGPVRTEWLPRSAGSVPGEPDRMTRLGPGVPPGWVARAVVADGRGAPRPGGRAPGAGARRGPRPGPRALARRHQDRRLGAAPHAGTGARPATGLTAPEV